MDILNQACSFCYSSVYECGVCIHIYIDVYMYKCVHTYKDSTRVMPEVSVWFGFYELNFSLLATFLLCMFWCVIIQSS